MTEPGNGRLKKDPSVVPEVQCPEWGYHARYVSQKVTVWWRKEEEGDKKIQKGHWTIRVKQASTETSAGKIKGSIDTCTTAVCMGKR